MNILIVGCGKVGSHLANMLFRQGHDVSVLDEHAESFSQLDDDFAGFTLQGVAIDQDNLRQAGIEGCDALAAVTNDDNTNIMVCEIASRVFHVSRTVARVYDPSRESIFTRFNVRSLSPTSLTASTISSMLMDQKTARQVVIDGSILNVDLLKVPFEWVGATFEDIASFTDPSHMYLGALDEAGHIVLASDHKHTMLSTDRLVAVSIVR